MVDQTPEFNDMRLLPHGPARPHNILPIGFRSYPRRHQMKKVGRVPASDIAHFYLQMNMSTRCVGVHMFLLNICSLPSSAQGPNHSGSSRNKVEWLMAILGKPSLRQNHLD